MPELAIFLGACVMVGALVWLLLRMPRDDG